tara:strand:+ start:616 stop:843 length:228 start_codon:yes stop_codon:yes gene_type:complete
MNEIYLNTRTCDYFDVPYRGSKRWWCSGDALLRSRPDWDSAHTEFLKTNASKTILLQRTEAEQGPGWYSVKQIIG